VCGIIGYIGQDDVEEIVLSGLERLEYRGYDSAGLVTAVDGDLRSVRAVGNLKALRSAVDDSGLILSDKNGINSGMGHTRWATHGAVTESNAHPHSSMNGRIQIVLNGIVENYQELKKQLIAEGCTFTSETDTEVVVHLVAKYYEGDLTEAVSRAYRELKGHYAFVVISADSPDTLVAARKECPLVVGRGKNGEFIGSALPAFLEHTQRIQMINDDEIVTLTPSGVSFQSSNGEPLDREIEVVDWDISKAEKAGYETFMLKEIYEQPEAVAETVVDRTALESDVELGDTGSISNEFLSGIQRVVVVACGTSYHAGLVGRYAIERWAKVPVEMDIASEYRYRDPVVTTNDLVIGISQSGETADTLAAMRLAKSKGAKVLAITNVMGSQATRDADGVLYTRAGLEIGVAATKTFVSQVAAMYLLGLRIATLKDSLSSSEISRLTQELRQIPDLMQGLIEKSDSWAKMLAEELSESEFFLYLGRNIGLPIALEGALKLKEISYIATDAYAAGEMKHGPIALLDQQTPVICIATDSPVLSKLVSNMEEVRARGARVVAVVTEGADGITDHAEDWIAIPKTDWLLQPILAIVPLQLLAYYIAMRRGLNVDQPRNLAKTVTVE